MLAALPGADASMPVTGTLDVASKNYVFGCADATLQQYGVTETSTAASFVTPRSVICPRRKFYDRGSGDAGREITSFSGLPVRLQRLPEQKSLPSAQALTQRESGPLMAIVA